MAHHVASWFSQEGTYDYFGVADLAKKLNPPTPVVTTLVVTTPVVTTPVVTKDTLAYMLVRRKGGMWWR